MTKLQDIFNSHTGRSSGKWKHYFDVYDRYLQPFIGTEFTLLEIGISQGGSLQIWKKYFGSKVNVVGIDIDQKSMYTEPQIQTFCGNQSDPNFLDTVIKQAGTPSVIIDDGSHDQLDVLNSLHMLWPKLALNGIYVIEDTHTAYWQEWKGGINSPLNVVSVSSRFVHDVNIQHIKEPYTPVLREIRSISYYDSMIVLEKALETKKESCSSGMPNIQPVSSNETNTLSSWAKSASNSSGWQPQIAKWK